MSAFYAELKTPTQIRLLNLERGRGDDVLRAKLLVGDLEDAPWYNAISYTWGDPQEPRHTIVIDGRNFEIRHNLWVFLRKLRELPEHYLRRPIWVDSLCINQKDSGEKGRQLWLISRIFQQAFRVLAWVGEHSHDSELLFRPDPRRADYRALLSDREHRAWCYFLQRRY
jgi:hypothetical protein